MHVFTGAIKRHSAPYVSLSQMIDLTMTFEEEEDEGIRALSDVVDRQLLYGDFLSSIKVCETLDVSICKLLDLIFLETPID